ncbi:MAG: AAA family ATPase [Bacteroidaceae bacterium]|nr:AAA family ATPase [Bacteroidaceae bacterium]
MKVETFCTNCFENAKQFGLIEKTDEKKQNVVIRKNFASGEGNVPYFAFINPVEAPSGPYSDFSLVFFPVGKAYEDKYVMSIGVGSEGFRDDYELATHPGMRRLFLKLLPGDENHYPFCKPKFTDIETSVDFTAVKEATGVSLERYKTVLSIGCLIDSTKDDDLKIVNAWIAQYASIRKWPTNGGLRKEVNKAINQVRNTSSVDNKSRVEELLNKRRFVVLQGAPGTGKTFLAEEIAKGYDKVVFTQFHAETTFSDFVFGIFPKLNSNTIQYEDKYGELCQAIKYATENEDKKVVLIIDEINRANLANVLGPVFYLFEPKRTGSTNSIKIGEREILEIPKNLHVIATMNTADRSIAVVDFALRRRFAWYTMKPECFSTGVIPAGKDLFEEVAAIFEKHASDDELNLQPGGSYFMADSEEELKQKIEYELMPLIKEYLVEGLIASAAGDFSDLFYRKIKKNLFE